MSRITKDRDVHHVAFHFAREDALTPEQLAARGIVYQEVVVRDPQTGAEHVLRLPEPQEPYYCTPQRGGDALSFASDAELI